MKTILPFLLILACPLMMLLMMRGMHGGSPRDKADDQGVASAPGRDGHTVLEERVHDLEMRLACLEEERGASADRMPVQV